MYNSTPHSTTGIAPSSLMFGRILRDKLPDFSGFGSGINQESVRDKDWEKKLKDAEYTDLRRQAKLSQLKEGDVVVVKRMLKENKLSSTFGPEEFEIIKLQGSDATLRSTETNRIFHRNVSHLKRLPSQSAGSLLGKSSDVLKDHITDSIPGNANNQPEATNTEFEIAKERPTRTIRKPAYLDEYQAK